MTSIVQHPTGASSSQAGGIPWRRVIRTISRAIVAIAVIGGVVYWLKFAPISVTVHRVQRGSIVGSVMGTGTLEARVQTTISPKISGRLRSIHADQGDTVEADQVLLQLDDEELTQQVAVAQAGVDTAKASIERLKADAERTEAVVAQARRHHLRVKSLADKNATTPDAMDEAVEGLAIAAAGVSHSEAALVEGEQQLAAAQKTLEYHRARLADTTIIAPFAGLIVQRQRDPGDVVVPGSGVLTLISTDEIWIRAWVDETEMGRLKQGQPADVVFRSEPDRSWPGEVSRLGRQADRETREFVVDVLVRELPENWAVGQRAEVYIEFDRHEDVVVLPVNRLAIRDERPGVYVIENDTVTWRDVSTGLRDSEFVEIIDGLDAGDAVIVLTNNQKASLVGRRVNVQ